MGAQAGDRSRSSTTSGAPARAARRWRPATLVAVAAVAILLASGAGRDSHPPQESEIAARPGVEQVEPLGGKLYPPRYDTLDYELNQLVARHEGRDAAPGTPATVAGRVINVVVRLDPAYVHEVAAYLREQGAGVAERGAGAEYLSAAVPLSALADLAGRPGVHLVTAEPPIQRLSDGIAPHAPTSGTTPAGTEATTPTTLPTSGSASSTPASRAIARASALARMARFVSRLVSRIRPRSTASPRRRMSLAPTT